MITRNLSPTLRSLARQYPVVTVTGPRQSGKTTLCRAEFPSHRYVTLEPLDTRSYARTDPRGFLSDLAEGAIIDEVQNVPELLSYVQEEVDARPEPGRFVLTGSQHFGLSAAVGQSLAGRTAIVELLPPSLDELRRFAEPPRGLWEVLWEGAYPRIHDARLPAARWLADYVTTYVERDVRQLANVGDLSAFTVFVRLAAGRTAQEINLSSLGADTGVSHHTARAWLSVLEASYVCFRAPAWHANHRKRLVKAAKLHFFDSGLACHLLGIRTPDELALHPLRGALFESWVAAEAYKAAANRGDKPALAHYRETGGLESDLVVGAGAAPLLVECKSGATLPNDAFHSLRKLRAEVFTTSTAAVVYGGAVSQRRSDGRVVAWGEVPGLFESTAPHPAGDTDSTE